MIKKATGKKMPENIYHIPETEDFKEIVKGIVLPHDFQENWPTLLRIPRFGRHFFIHCVKSGASIDDARLATNEATKIVDEGKYSYDDLLELLLPLSKIQNIISRIIIGEPFVFPRGNDE